MRLRHQVLAFTLALLAAPAVLADLPRYRVTVLAGEGSWASAINSTGQVAGNQVVGGFYHGFLYSSGVLADLGGLGSSGSLAYGLNDLGQVVGGSEMVLPDGSSAARGFLYSGGTMTAILPGRDGRASAINNAGQVTGVARYDTAAGAQSHAYLWSSGSAIDLGTLPTGDASRGLAINQDGLVAGAAAPVVNGQPNLPENAFIFRDGTMIDLGDGGLGGIWSAASGLNDAGLAVGWFGAAADPLSGELFPTRAFLYQGGTARLIGQLRDHYSSWAYDINNLGQVVGGSFVNYGDSHAFLWQDGVMTDLNTLIDPASGWVLREATGINDLGQIAGRACMGEQCFAVRLDLVPAVPEPAAPALLLAGLLPLAWWVRRPAGRRRG